MRGEVHVAPPAEDQVSRGLILRRPVLQGERRDRDLRVDRDLEEGRPEGEDLRSAGAGPLGEDHGALAPA